MAPRKKDAFTQEDVKAIKGLLGKAESARKLHIFNERDVGTLQKVAALLGNEQNWQMIVDGIEIGNKLRPYGVVGKSFIRGAKWSAAFAIGIFAVVKGYEEARASLMRWLGW